MHIASLTGGRVTSAAAVRSTSDIRTSRSSGAAQDLARGGATAVEHVTRPTRPPRESRSLAARCPPIDCGRSARSSTSSKGCVRRPRRGAWPRVGRRPAGRPRGDVDVGVTSASHALRPRRRPSQHGHPLSRGLGSSARASTSRCGGAQPHRHGLPGVCRAPGHEPPPYDHGGLDREARRLPAPLRA